MNNEDMSEIINKFSSMLNNNSSNNEASSSSDSGNLNISPETISAMAQMLSSRNNSDETHEKSDTNSVPNIDIDTILKFKNAFDKMNSKDDPRSKLLLALKPYLKESRKEKLEQYIQIFNISKVIDIFGLASGGDVKK